MNNTVFLKFVFNGKRNIGTPGILLFDANGNRIGSNRVVRIVYDDFKTDMPATPHLFDGSSTCRLWFTQATSERATIIVEFDMTNINRIVKVGLCQWPNGSWTNNAIDVYISKDNENYTYGTTVALDASVGYSQYRYQTCNIPFFFASQSIKSGVENVIANNKLFKKYVVIHEEE